MTRMEKFDEKIKQQWYAKYGKFGQGKFIVYNLDLYHEKTREIGKVDANTPYQALKKLGIQKASYYPNNVSKDEFYYDLKTLNAFRVKRIK